MIKIRTELLFILIFVALVFGIHAAFAVENPGHGRSLSVRFPAFSLNSGEKVAGIKLRTSQGQFTHSCLPKSWTCERAENTLHCFTIHQSYAVTVTSMLPELYIRNIPSNVSQLSIEATVEYVNNAGNEYSKEFREGDLIIK
jgi:hypothetical protein